jgi:ferredoxin-fold anticodon binding domain-containing protein
LVAANKKAAHEAGQSLRPGQAVEVFGEAELSERKAYNRERTNLDRWMDMVSLTIAEDTDRLVALKRLKAAKRCIEVLEQHFTEVL